MSDTQAKTQTKTKRTGKAAGKSKQAKQDGQEKLAPNSERLMQVILAPQISEKSTYVADKHEQAAFRVVSDATKAEIKAAVELMFNVKVDKVQVANVKGKIKRFGRTMGRRKDWKKAYVCLQPGQEINLAPTE